MEFSKLEEPLTGFDLACTSVIIKNDRYQDSLNLLLEDFDSERIVYFPADKDGLFVDTENEHKGKSVATFYIDETSTVTYSQILFESYRMSAYLTLTESLGNELLHNAGKRFYENSNDSLNEQAKRPLDEWLGFSAHGYAFATAIDVANIEEAIVSLNDAVFDMGKTYLPEVLKVAYFNGERYAITKEQINEILNPVE